MMQRKVLRLKFGVLNKSINEAKIVVHCMSSINWKIQVTDRDINKFLE